MVKTGRIARDNLTAAKDSENMMDCGKSLPSTAIIDHFFWPAVTPIAISDAFAWILTTIFSSSIAF